MGAFALAGLLLGPVGVSHAQEALPVEIQFTLADAAAEGDQALLDAVAAAVLANSELAQAIVDEATRLNPDLADAIVAAAIEAGGEVGIVPAAGPALLPALAGLGAAGGATAALGGGGGSDGSAPPPPPPPSEFDAQAGLGLINAQTDYDRGLTGAPVDLGGGVSQDIIIAVVDSGLDITHPEFAGQIAPGGFDFVNLGADMTDPHGHGTHVGGIIAANQDDVGMHGAAFNAQLQPFRVFNEFGLALDDFHSSVAFDSAVENGAAIINNSWGTRGADVTDPAAVTAWRIANEHIRTRP